MTSAKISVSIFLLMALAILLGCTSASTSFDAANRYGEPVETSAAGEANQQDLRLQTSGNAEGQIRVGDLLEIAVYRVGELDRTVRVDQDGTISLILIGQVNAIGKTERELEFELERLYAIDYLQDPEISVFVMERAAS